MAQVSKNSELDVSSEFIESCKLKAKQKKRGGSYSKTETMKRQDKVHKLHFDYGYSARKISELMNINRNTINTDVHYWYSKIHENSSVIDPGAAILFRIHRFDVQRSRLRESLDKVETFQEIHAIEKMIFDIDSKIIHIKITLSNSMKHIHTHGVEIANNCIKKFRKDIKLMTLFDTIAVSEKAQKRISKIIKEDRKKTGI